jgi:hypothetical protein
VFAFGVSWALMGKVRKPLLIAVVFIVGAQLLGALAEWLLLSSATTLWFCLPGLALQIGVVNMLK